MLSDSAVPDDYQPLAHVVRALKSSECRTPIFFVLSDGDPFHSVARLAKDVGSTVWRVEMGNPKNEQNALDYVDVGIQNGDWVYVTQNEAAVGDVHREIAKILVTLQPDPKKYPRREHFRIFFTVENPIDLNDNIALPFPRLLVKNGILARRRTEAAEAVSPTKLTKRRPEEVDLAVKETLKHQQRREAGRESDSESDADEPEKKLTGLWFHRAVDFFTTDEGTNLMKPQDEIYIAIDKEDVERIKELCQSGKLDISKVKKSDMTPLQYAVSWEKVNATRALLEAGADPNQVRESDGCPPLFMSLELEELLFLLLEYGADIHSRFEGDRIENHPSTSPNVAALVKKVRGGEVVIQEKIVERPAPSS